MSPSPRLHVGAALVAAVVMVAAGACSDPPPDPDQERLERIEARLDESFSGAQVTCILDLLDGDALRALDRTADLDPDTEVFTAYSGAVASCVADPEAPLDPTEAPDTADGAPADDRPDDEDPGSGDEGPEA